MDRYSPTAHEEKDDFSDMKEEEQEAEMVYENKRQKSKFTKAPEKEPDFMAEDMQIQVNEKLEKLNEALENTNSENVRVERMKKEYD